MNHYQDYTQINRILIKKTKNKEQLYDLWKCINPFFIPRVLFDVDREAIYKKRQSLKEMARTAKSFCKNEKMLNLKKFIFGNGYDELLKIFLRVFPGDIYCIKPCDPNILLYCKYFKKTLHLIDTKKSNYYKLMPSELIKITDKNKKCLIFGNPNPISGVVYNEEELERIGILLNINNWIVFSVECNRYQIQCISNNISISNYCKENTICCFSLSGNISYKKPIGFLGFPSNLNQYYSKCLYSKKSIYPYMNNCGLYVLKYFMMNIDLFKYYNRKINEYMIIIFAECESFLANTTNIVYSYPGSGFSILLDVNNYKENLNSRGIFTNNDLMFALLKETGILIKTGDYFGFKSDDLMIRYFVSEIYKDEENEHEMNYYESVRVLKEIYYFLKY